MFSEMLKKLRLERNLSQGELAKIIGISKSTIGMYEQGKRMPKADATLTALAEYFNVTIDYLIGLSSENRIGTEKQTPDTLPPGAKPYNPKIHEIPILGTISAGLPLYAEQHIEGYTYTDRNGGAEYFALRVKGDSMNAVGINEGNTLIVRRQPEVENGELAVVMVNEDNATVKYFQRDRNMIQLIPRSFNPIHQVQEYDLKKNNIKIIGKVVECKIEFN